MPKRRNPFGDPFATEFKLHISQKEVDMGVNKEHNMKAVYEKTLAMLCAGQRDMKQTKGFNTNNDHQHMNGQQQVNGQMNGHLNGHLNGHMNGHVNGHMNGHMTEHVNGHMNGHINGHINGQAMNGQINGHSPTAAQANSQPNVFQQLMSNAQKVTNGHSQMDIDMADEKQELVPGQSFLDSHCRLVNSLPNGGNLLKPMATLAAGCTNNSQSLQHSCQMCQTKRVPKSQCSFCNKLLCADCVRQCENCEDRFCTLCSAVNYDERYERIFCVNCSARQIEPCWTNRKKCGSDIFVSQRYKEWLNSCENVICDHCNWIS